MADAKNEPDSNIQNFTKDLPVLEVKRAWKGIEKEYVALEFDFDGTSAGGTCPWFYKFEDDRDYLIFAYGRDLKVTVECSDTRELQPRYDWTIREIGKLDNFWFRTKARLWPF